MFTRNKKNLSRRLTLLMALLFVGVMALTALPRHAAAAGSAEYELETSGGRTCRVTVNAEQVGGLPIFRRIEFSSDVICDPVWASASPTVGGAILALYDTATAPLGVVLTYGERSGGFGYGCADIDTRPCSDDGQFPLSLAGNYYAQSNFSIGLEATDETWATLPDGCTLVNSQTATCGLRSEILNVGLLR